jgi:hypothetical protein
VPKVKLDFVREETGWGDFESVDVYVDGKRVGGGTYGGEPEDNTRCRDWAWVEHTIECLSKALGAEVEVSERTEEAGLGR